MENKTRNMTQKITRTLKDGTVKEYTINHTYTVKGHISESGDVLLFTDEQIAEMKKRYADGVTKKRLAKDYNTCYNSITKYLNM